jgi:single-strand DNA-binding protein
MAKSFNQAILMGNVGKDPEISIIPTNNPNEPNVKVAQFSLATTKGGYKRQDGTDVPEVTQWHHVVAWRKLAEIVEKYVKKGDKLFVTGEIQYRTYDHKQHPDVKMYVTDIVASDINLTGKGDGNGSGRPAIGASNVPQAGATAGYQGQQAAAPQVQQQGGQPFPPPADGATGGTDNDLPF